MTDKQIIADGRFIPMEEAIKAGLISEKDIDVLSKQIIDYKNLCENYNKEVGCFGTFDGSCIKEQCFTYKLLQQLQAKEQECEELKGIRDRNFLSALEERKRADKLSKTLTEIKKIAEKQCNVCEALTPIEEYKDCKKCWQGVILQKISEVENV